MKLRRLAAGLTLAAAIAAGAVITAPQASADTGWGSPSTGTTNDDTGWGTPPADGTPVQTNDTGWG
ncbi:hypothetical protein ACL07V_37005 [Streptomyces sp. MB22_4]|uniref:hypothetical protein n=1 Tax=Streptomyces sp. MB22_4 TaxID=3383120 RepID=UPI00399EFD04